MYKKCKQLTVRRLHVEVLELPLELVHRRRYLVDVHGRQALVHPPYDTRHRLRDGVHANGSLETGGDGVYPRRESEAVQRLVLLFSFVVVGVVSVSSREVATSSAWWAFHSRYDDISFLSLTWFFSRIASWAHILAPSELPC